MVPAAVPPVIKCIQCFSFIPVWSTSRGMGGVPHSHNTVILICAISFLLNHDPDLRIFSLRTSGPTTAGFQAFAMTSTQQPSNVWRTGDEAFKLYMTRKTQGWFQASSAGVALALPARPPPPPNLRSGAVHVMAQQQHVRVPANAPKDCLLRRW